jgi:hypothetical protein
MSTRNFQTLHNTPILANYAFILICIFFFQITTSLKQPSSPRPCDLSLLPHSSLIFSPYQPTSTPPLSHFLPPPPPPLSHSQTFILQPCLDTNLSTGNTHLPQKSIDDTHHKTTTARLTPESHQ